MTELKLKIDGRLDHLQQLMEGNAHLDRPEYVSDVIESITKFWRALDEADKDYVESARYALIEELPWNIEK